MHQDAADAISQKVHLTHLCKYSTIHRRRNVYTYLHRCLFLFSTCAQTIIESSTEGGFYFCCFERLLLLFSTSAPSSTPYSATISFVNGIQGIDFSNEEDEFDSSRRRCEGPVQNPRVLYGNVQECRYFVQASFESWHVEGTARSSGGGRNNGHGD